MVVKKTQFISVQLTRYTGILDLFFERPLSIRSYFILQRCSNILLFETEEKQRDVTKLVYEHIYKRLS